MTRNLFVLYTVTKDSPRAHAELLYANGITLYRDDIQHLKTVREVSAFLRAAGYVDPGSRCNPECLSYVAVILEWQDGLLIFCSADKDD